MRLHKDIKKGDYFSAAAGLCSQKNDLQPHNPLEPCRARMVSTSGSQMLPTNNKEDQRSTVIRGETTATSGAKPAARAQPIGFFLLSASAASVKFYY